MIGASLHLNLCSAFKSSVSTPSTTSTSPSTSFFISYFFFLYNSFGPESTGNLKHNQMHKNSALLGNGGTSKSTECLTLEPSELLLIDYHCNGLTTATFTGAESNNLASGYTYHHHHHHNLHHLHHHHNLHHSHLQMQQQLQTQMHQQLHHLQALPVAARSTMPAASGVGGGSGQSIGGSSTSSGATSSASVQELQMHQQFTSHHHHHQQQSQQQSKVIHSQQHQQQLSQHQSQNSLYTSPSACPINGTQVQLQYGALFNQTYLHNYMTSSLNVMSPSIPWMPHQRAASMYSCHSDTTTNTTSSDSELDLNGLNEGLVDDDDDDLNEEELSKLALNADELLYNNLLLTNNNNNLINSLISNHKPPSNQLLHLRQVLEKNALDRTDEDNETILSYINSLSAFDKYDQATKKQLASVMILAIIENPFTVILTHNETLDSFCCLIHGTVEHLISSNDAFGRTTVHTSKILHPGDVFGITEPTMETIYFEGIMKTLTPFCWFLCVTQLDFYRILSTTELEIIKHEEDGKVTLVTELRKIDAQKRGHVVIRGTPERLLAGVLENDNSDPFYIDDFLLTYRVFMPEAPTSVALNKAQNTSPTDSPNQQLTTSNQSQANSNQSSSLILTRSNSNFAHLVKGMEQICSNLLYWFDDMNMRDKVIRIVLTWINNYYLDFDLISGCVSGNQNAISNNPGQLFLDLFERKLSANVSLLTQLRLLHIGLSTKARTRHINLTRSNRDEEILQFSIMGGYERGYGIFVNKVEPHSKVEQLGLRRGDQILEVNGINFTIIPHTKALDVLKSTTHLQLTVKYNPFMFKEMLSAPEGARNKKSSLSSALLPFPNTNSVSPLNLRKHSTGSGLPNLTNGHVSVSNLNPNASGGSGKWQFPNNVTGSGTKIKKAIPKFANFISKHLNFNSDESNMINDQVDFVKPLPGRSLSNPDLHTSSQNSNCTNSPVTDVNHFCQIQQQVLRIFNAATGEHRFLFVHPETSAREVVMISVREFNLSSSKSSNEQVKSSLSYALYEVSVVPEANNTIKQRRLPDQLNNLAERASIHSRYYIKENTIFGASSTSSGSAGQSASSNPNQLSDEVSVEIIKECPMPITLLSLNTTLLGYELTQIDFDIFQAIEPQNFIFDLFEMETEQLNENKLQEFEALSNKEMFWVINEILNEPSIVKRVKIIKYFIKVANICRNVRNYNSMFAILSGLGHGSVQRLKQTWEKLSTKYHKIFKTLQILMDPSRNMMHYRRELSSRSPPIIPFFPIVKKDLTFLHLAHMTTTSEDQLVNFDKMRMISKEIRAIVHMSSEPYVFPSSVACSGQACAAGICSGASPKIRSQVLPEISGGVPLPPPPPTAISGSNVIPKRLFEEALMRKKVRHYLEACFSSINYDEIQLTARSFEIEPGQSSSLNQSQHSHSSSSLKQTSTSKDTPTTSNGTASTNANPKMHGSPTLSSTSSGSSSGRLKFGAESPHQLRKLMSLSEVCESGKSNKSHHHNQSLAHSTNSQHSIGSHLSGHRASEGSLPLSHLASASHSHTQPQMPPPSTSTVPRFSNQSSQIKSNSVGLPPLPTTSNSTSQTQSCSTNSVRTISDNSNILFNTVSFNAPLSMESSSVTSLRRLEQLQQLKKLHEQQQSTPLYYYNGSNSNTVAAANTKCSSPVQRPPLPNYDEAVQRQQKLANLVSSTVVRSVSSSSSSSTNASSRQSNSGAALEDENKVSTV